MAKRIKQTFAFKYLKYPEEAEYHTELLLIVARIGAAALGAEDIVPLYSAAVEAFNRSIGIPRYSEYTPGIQALHGKMIRAFDCLSYAVAAVENDLDTDKAAEGASLRRVLDKYKRARSDNYEASAADIRLVTEEFGAGEYAAYVAANGLEGWVAALAALFAEFDVLVQKRFEERGAVPRGAAKRWRAACRLYLEALRDRVNSRIYPEAVVSAAVEVFVNAVHALNNRYAALARPPGRRGLGPSAGSEKASEAGGRPGER